MSIRIIYRDMNTSPSLMPRKTDERVTALIDSLSRLLRKDQVATSGPIYDASRRVWNAGIDRHPGVVAFCENTDDVRGVVRAARQFNVSLSVRGGGHDWSGRAVQGELVIDLSRMRQVSVEDETATISGGALTRDVVETTSPLGLCAVTGILGSVGFAGLSTGGGYGATTAKFGMASDNIIGAEIVLADGRVVHTDRSNDPDLFWAIRGGGGNFGVVTSLQVKVHPVPTLLFGMIEFPWSEASALLTALDRALPGLPEELTIKPLFISKPDGSPGMVLFAAWCGDPDDDASIIRFLTSLAPSAQPNLTRKSLAEGIREIDQFMIEGASWVIRTVTLPSLHPEAMKVLLRAMERRSSPLTWFGTHMFYGAGERIALGDTSFGIRQRHIVIGIYTAWREGEYSLHRAWADEVERDLRPYALASSYANYFGADRAEQAAAAFGENSTRLVAIKKQYDPDGTFAAISLPR